MIMHYTHIWSFEGACLCPVGQYWRQGRGFAQCKQCNKGLHNDNITATECKACPHEKPFTFERGSISLSNCTVDPKVALAQKETEAAAAFAMTAIANATAATAVAMAATANDTAAKATAVLAEKEKEAATANATAATAVAMAATANATAANATAALAEKAKDVAAAHAKAATAKAALAEKDTEAAEADAESSRLAVL